MRNFNTICLDINQFKRNEESFVEISFEWKETYESVSYEIFGNNNSVYNGKINSVVSTNNFYQIFKICENEHLSIRYTIEDKDEIHMIFRFLNDLKLILNILISHCG